MELVDTEIENCSCAFELTNPISKMDVKNSSQNVGNNWTTNINLRPLTNEYDKSTIYFPNSSVFHSINWAK